MTFPKNFRLHVSILRTFKPNHIWTTSEPPQGCVFDICPWAPIPRPWHNSVLCAARVSHPCSARVEDLGPATMLLLMVQKSSDHHLRLVVFSTSQVVITGFLNQQQYGSFEEIWRVPPPTLQYPVSTTIMTISGRCAFRKLCVLEAPAFFNWIINTWRKLLLMEEILHHLGCMKPL